MGSSFSCRYSTLRIGEAPPLPEPQYLDSSINNKCSLSKNLHGSVKNVPQRGLHIDILSCHTTFVEICSYHSHVN